MLCFLIDESINQLNVFPENPVTHFLKTPVVAISLTFANNCVFKSEFYYRGNDKVDGYKETIHFITKVNEKLNHDFNINSYFTDCVILESSNMEKFSLHIIFSKAKFRNNQVCGFWIESLINSLSNEDKNRLSVVDKSGKKTLLIDTRVYTKNRQFRCMNKEKYFDFPVTFCCRQTTSINVGRLQIYIKRK